MFLKSSMNMGLIFTWRCFSKHFISIPKAFNNGETVVLETDIILKINVLPTTVSRNLLYLFIQFKMDWKICHIERDTFNKPGRCKVNSCVLVTVLVLNLNPSSTTIPAKVRTPSSDLKHCCITGFNSDCNWEVTTGSGSWVKLQGDLQPKKEIEPCCLEAAWSQRKKKPQAALSLTCKESSYCQWLW